MKILVRGANWIGDAVMSIPALRELRRVFPEARITLHTRSWADGLFQDASFIDELVTFDKGWAVRDLYDNARFLKDDGYDAAILLPNSFEAALTVFFARIPRRFGYNKDLRELFLSDPIPVPEWANRQHQVYYYLNLIEATQTRLIGRSTVSRDWPDISLEVSDERKAAARAFLAEHGVDPQKRLAVLGAGSKNALARRWPAERYAQLNDILQADLGINVVLAESKGEADVAAEIRGHAKFPPIDLTGLTDIAEAAALLSVADIMISNDMGQAHVSAAVGTDTIVICGPTDPQLTRPFAPCVTVMRSNVECSPCHLRDCPIDHRCMTRVSVEEVFATVGRLLNPAPPPDIDDLAPIG